MSYYDPWTHFLKLFFTRVLQFIVASLLLGLLAWYTLLRLLDADFVEGSRAAYEGNLFNLRVMLILCLIIGALVTGWLFSWLMMRWPARNRGTDRHHRGARVIERDDE